MIHSVIPLQLILNQVEWKSESKFIRSGGLLMEVVSGPQGDVLRRLHTTDPMQYLNPALAPGQPVKRTGGQ